MLAGAMVGTLPFLGFPPSWDTAILFILGVFIFVLGVVVRRRGRGSRNLDGPTVNDRHPSQSSPVDTTEVV